MISEKTIEDTIYQLYKKAAIELGEDVKSALEDALKREDNDLGKLNIEAILKNIELAQEKSIPMCQDTGLPIIFVKLYNNKTSRRSHHADCRNCSFNWICTH